jgi:hypothetical protein
MFKRYALAVLTLSALTVLAVLAGCGHSTVPIQPKSSGYGTVSVKLTDAPADVDRILLDVSQVWVHRVNNGTPVDTSGSGDDASLRDRHATPLADYDGVWYQLSATSGVYDLLDLTNGIFKTLAVGSVPAGTYDQVRLKLGPNNSIVVKGVTHPLKVPSGQQAGFQLYGLFDVPIDGTVEVGIDFDAARSVHETGSGVWIMTPMARIVPIRTAGSIHGTVSPASATSWVYAMMGSDTVTSTRTGADGGFTLSLLAEGDYAVHIVPTVAGFDDVTLSPVHVASGQTTDVGTIALGGAQPGRLIGMVTPNNFTTRAYLLQSGSAKDSIDTGAGGSFAFENVAAGTYDVHLVPQNASFLDTTLTGLLVSPGATTDVGTVALPPVPPLFADEFLGNALSALWQAASWQGGGSAVVGGGIVTIDGYGLTSNATFGAGHSLEFMATFRGDPFQNVGFATGATFDAPWVTFGTGTAGDAVYARTSTGSNVSLGAGLIGGPHLYRIDWDVTGFTFSVDGVIMTTVPAPVATNMNIELSDFNPTGTALDVDWVHLTSLGGPAARRATSTSRVTTPRSITGWSRRSR